MNDTDALLTFPRDSYIQGPLSNDALEDLYVACQDFLTKCDIGLASSNRSYKIMEAAVKKAESKQ